VGLYVRMLCARVRLRVCVRTCALVGLCVCARAHRARRVHVYTRVVYFVVYFCGRVGRHASERSFLRPTVFIRVYDGAQIVVSACRIVQFVSG